MRKRELRQQESVDITAEEKRRIAGAAWRISNHYQCEREDVERQLFFSIVHACETYEPSFGLSLADYRRLCLHNGITHLCRKLKPVADQSRVTDHFADVVCGTWTLGDTLAERRNGPARMRRTLEIREWLGGLTGLPWCVALASLCGLKFSEIARKLGIPRTTFDRRFAPIFTAFREEVNDVV